jgi:amino acid permease
MAAYLALSMCMFIVLVAGGAPLWNTAIWRRPQDAASAFVGAYGPCIIFLLTWLSMKLSKYQFDLHRWQDNPLSQLNTGFLPVITDLHSKRRSAIKVAQMRTTRRNERQQRRNWWAILLKPWGIGEPQRMPSAASEGCEMRATRQNTPQTTPSQW